MNTDTLQTHELNLSIALQNFWHIGTGKSSGHHLDALVEKDSHDLPLIPGRMVKGLLRDAVNRLETWGHFSAAEADVVKTLFGDSGFVAEGEPRNKTQGGCLRFGSATLPPQLSQWLSQEGQQTLRQGMYQDLYSTAIEARTGVAKKYSLRGIQVTIPMSLQTSIIEIKATDLAWMEIIEKALPLIRAVGANRSRGLGRSVWTVQKSKQGDKQ